ncbi:MAG: AMP-binding protein [Pseudomonadota bacterium]
MQRHFDAFAPDPANHVALSPLSFLDRAAVVYAEDPAIAYGDMRRTWAQTARRIRRVAAGLRMRGIKLGDTVAVLSPNIPELFELHYAVPMAGGVLAAINIRLEPETIGYILDHSDCRIVICDSALRSTLNAAFKTLKRPLPVIDIIDPNGPEPEESDNPNYEDLTRPSPLPAGSYLPADEWQAIALNYTSGTSGRPKGVVYHHRGAYLMAMGTVAAWEVPQRLSYLSVVPMFHCNGWCHPWMMAIVGGQTSFVRDLDPARMFDTIARERVTHLGAAPVVLQMLAESDTAPTEPFDPPIHTMTAGAPPPPAILERTAAMGMEVMHVYGLTETYGHITQCLPKPAWSTMPPAEQAEHRARQGIAFPMVEEIAVIDQETGQPVPPDGETQGEIAIRANTVMKGYYKNAEASAEALKDGWFWSGDAAVVHPDGYVQIRDRLKDVIISGGENVSSVEVEAMLYRHPDVQTAAVVAKPDPKWGEVPCAFVELRDGASATEDDIIAFCRDHLAGFKTPKTVLFTEIPKTATGKVQKFVLRARAQDLS